MVANSYEKYILPIYKSTTKITSKKIKFMRKLYQLVSASLSCQEREAETSIGLRIGLHREVQLIL